MNTFFQDVRYGWRMLAKNLGFKTVAVVTLALGIGVAGALVLTRFLSSLLFGVRPTDAATFGGAFLFLTAVALTASYIPARRATKVDPLVALHHK